MNTKSKYHKEIKPGVVVDVYDVLKAYGVTCPAIAHAIKKLLMPGQRGGKSVKQDLTEAGQSVDRAIELDTGCNDISINITGEVFSQVGKSLTQKT